MSLFAELKRRNVIRVAVAYLVASWLVLQIADVLVDALELPSVWSKGLVALLVVGFIPVMVFAWVYELTPDGVKKESEIAPGESASAHAAKKLDVAVIVLLVAALGMMGYQQFFAGHPASAVRQASGPESHLDRGIAVLPFDNLSADADNAYFAGGVHEEVLTNLSRIPELRVISRTSMLKIAETELDVRAIGERLGVSHVLEGSVRRAGDRVRVTVQLIDAATDEHIWSENYDRTLDDIFAIQSGIALEIADKLQTTLSPETAAAIAERPTDSDEAYQLYLRAKDHRREWRGADTFRPMIPLLERALELDPEFHLARAQLVKAYGRMTWLREDPDGEFQRKAEEQMEIMRSRWPDRVETSMAEAGYQYTVNNDYARVVEILEPLQQQLPNDVDVIANLSSSYKRLGYTDRFVEAAERWVELDPESSSAHGELMFAYIRVGDFEKAERAALDGLERNPDSVGLRRLIAVLYFVLDRHEETIQMHEAVLALDPDLLMPPPAIWNAYKARGLEAAEAIYEAQVGGSLEPEEAGLAFYMGVVYRDAGVEPERADALMRQSQAVAEQDLSRFEPGSHEFADRAMYLAVSAAMIGERERAEELIPLGEAPEDAELLDRVAHAVVLAQAEAALGRKDAAMERLRAFPDHESVLRSRMLVQQIGLQLAFGDHPPFHEYLRSLEAGR